MTSFTESIAEFKQIQEEVNSLGQDVYTKIFAHSPTTAASKIGLSSGLGKGWLLGAPALELEQMMYQYDSDVYAELKLAEDVIPEHYQFIKREDNFWGISANIDLQLSDSDLSNQLSKPIIYTSDIFQEYIGVITLTISGGLLVPLIGAGLGLFSFNIFIAGCIGGVIGATIGLGVRKYYSPKDNNYTVDEDFAFELPVTVADALQKIDPELEQKLTKHFQRRAAEINVALVHARKIQNTGAIAVLDDDLMQLRNEIQQIIARAQTPTQLRQELDQYLYRRYVIDREAFLDAARSVKINNSNLATKNKPMVFTPKAENMSYHVHEQDVIEELHELKSVTRRIK
jgi:hypothetical protein